MPVIRVMRAAGSRTSLRRVLIAYAAFEVVDLAIWIVLLVYGYEHGGVTGSVVMSLVQLVPGAALRLPGADNWRSSPIATAFSCTWSPGKRS
jgi:hypothetical protein